MGYTNPSGGSAYTSTAGSDKVTQGGGDVGGQVTPTSEKFFLGTRDTPFVPAKAVRTIGETQSESLNNLLGWLMQSMGTLDPSIGQFTPQLPGPTDLQSASLTGLERLAAGDSGIFQDPATLAGLSSITDILNSGPADYMDYFETGIADPAQRDLERALSEVDARAVGSGNLFSSDRAAQQRDVSDDFFRNLSEERSRFGLETLNQSVENQLGALGLLPGVADIGYGRAETLFGIGEQERQIGVEQFEAERQEVERQQAAEQFILELLMRSSVSPTYGVAGGFPLQLPTDGGGFVGGLLGGLSP